MSNAEMWISYKENPSPELKQQIVLSYINLVHYVVNRTHLSQDGILDKRDFVQFGIEGLSQAIDRFDLNFGTKFETYAIQRIRGKIYDELRKYVEKHEPLQENENYSGYSNSSISLSQPIGEVEGIQVYETISDGSKTPDVLLEEKELKEKLYQVIGKQGDRDQALLSLYYYEEILFGDIATILGITISRVSQMHSRMIKKDFRPEFIKAGYELE